MDASNEKIIIEQDEDQRLLTAQLQDCGGILLTEKIIETTDQIYLSIDEIKKLAELFVP